MKESIGGSWLLIFVAFFVILFTAFLAVSINYTKAFKIKNYIINRIEFDEGYNIYSGNKKLESLDSSDGTTEADIYVYLKKVGYNGKSIKARNCINNEFGTTEADFKNGGYCVQEVTEEYSGQRYYKVTTFIVFELPFASNSFTIPINGETKTIYYEVE